MSEPLPTNIAPASSDQQPADAGAMLIDYLRHRDVACPRCGYNLRNLTVATCPECREPISLRVDARRYPIHWLLIALVPHMFCVGVSVIFCVAVARNGWPHMRGTEAGVTYFLLISAALGILIGVGHTHFLRLSRDSQILYLVLTWIAHVIALLTAFNI